MIPLMFCWCCCNDKEKKEKKVIFVVLCSRKRLIWKIISTAIIASNVEAYNTFFITGERFVTDFMIVIVLAPIS